MSGPITLASDNAINRDRHHLSRLTRIHSLHAELALTVSWPDIAPRPADDVAQELAIYRGPIIGDVRQPERPQSAVALQLLAADTRNELLGQPTAHRGGTVS